MVGRHTILHMSNVCCIPWPSLTYTRLMLSLAIHSWLQRLFVYNAHLTVTMARLHSMLLKTSFHKASFHSTSFSLAMHF